ncbi:hypothetical protein ARMSODRAFT_980229 [Armillaria solidipes]|uniref:Uncharacterized protein n=1 Tax=Armillaria solidipes TaxID=1076256 RepID=A0A2H3AWC7_9AGAR|nr:hypothetical protein ARMSODRAFT_980229 [Armillaria solidipes]
MTIEVKPLETPEKLDFPSVSRSKGNQEGNGRHDSNTQLHAETPFGFHIEPFGGDHIVTRMCLMKGEPVRDRNHRMRNRATARIASNTLFFTAVSGYVTNNRTRIVLGLRASRCNYYDVLPSRYSSTREENLKGSDIINDQKIHPFDMRLSVRIKFSMEQKEAREVSASNAPVLPSRWYLGLIQKGSNINLHKALAPQEKNVASAVVKKTMPSIHLQKA